MQITFLAQSGFIIEIENIKIGIDLWLNNPINPKSLNDIPKLEYLFLTHDHPDHGLKDLIEIAQRDNAIFISSSEIAKYAEEQGVTKVDRGNIGGSFKVDENLEVFLTEALHASDIGIPVGIIINYRSTIIYHMGDTGYFNNLKTYGELFEIDLLFVPIGSRYTMGPREAVLAVNDLKPKNVIPMHYNTSPKIQQDPDLFTGMVKNSNVLIMNPGDVINI